MEKVFKNIRQKYKMRVCNNQEHQKHGQKIQQVHMRLSFSSSHKAVPQGKMIQDTVKESGTDLQELPNRLEQTFFKKQVITIRS